MSFNDFADWLFPGDELPHRVRNAAIPGAAQDILEQVSCATDVPVAWLQKSARLVLDGLAGAQCLWYLHGLEGEIEAEVEVPTWAQLTGYNAQIPLWVRAYIEVPAVERDKTLDRIEVDDIDWAGGKITLTRYYLHPKYPKTTTQKLGKLLRRIAKTSQSPERFAGYIKEFETRDLPTWHWRISTHPFDVLTMSFNQPWTSCMRPGGVAELGPLTDMAAGSAIMFFYRSGADKACGRLVLRPCVGDGVWIASGKNIYGCGPDHVAAETLTTELAQASGYDIVVDEGPLCQWGNSSFALTRAIYSDTDRDYCRQGDVKYDSAYERLVNADWPPSLLDLGDLPLQAAEVRGLVKGTGSASGAIVDAAREVAEGWLEAGAGLIWDIAGLIVATEQGNIPSSDDEAYMESQYGVYDSSRELPGMIHERFEELLTERLATQDTFVYVLDVIPAAINDISLIHAWDQLALCGEVYEGKMEWDGDDLILLDSPTLPGDMAEVIEAAGGGEYAAVGVAPSDVHHNLNEIALLEEYALVVELPRGSTGAWAWENEPIDWTKINPGM